MKYKRKNINLKYQNKDNLNKNKQNIPISEPYPPTNVYKRLNDIKNKLMNSEHGPVYYPNFFIRINNLDAKIKHKRKIEGD
ncbi:MAG: hypothetical protein EU529_10335 [Promethearchaeota archaeon]|nr:MAG: hypothetical protein EU529_10335 [Candidatus Lokiarchaeota archaeon]